MSDESGPAGLPPPPQEPRWDDLPPATPGPPPERQPFAAPGHQGAQGSPSPPMPPPQQASPPATWGQTGAQPSWGQPAPGGWGDPGAVPPGYGNPTGRPKGTAPIWVVVVVGLVAFLFGGALGGCAGFMTGAGLDGFGAPPVGPGAAAAEGPVGAGAYDVGQFSVSNLRIRSDFADDFEVEADVRNDGDAYAGGAMEIDIRRGDERLGMVRGHLGPMDPGETVSVRLIGFDSYRGGYDSVQLRID